MELIIYNQQAKPEPIEFNYEELKKELAQRLEVYNTIAYSEDEIRSAKDDRAKLRKLKEAIDNRRKDIKKQCLAPYEDFEKKTKEIIAMIDKPIAVIDGQVKAYEEKVKAEKRQQIEVYYLSVIGDLKELLPLNRIWNDKWLNTTCSMKSIEEEITSVISKVRNDLEVIANLNSECDFQIKDVYLRTLDLSVALQEKARLEDLKVKQSEYEAKKVQRAEKPAPPDFSNLKPGDVVDFSGAITAESNSTAQPEPQEEEVVQIDFRVWATKAQLQSLKEFLKANNIKYGKAE